MDDEIGNGKLIYHIRIPLGEDPLKEAADDGFVLLGRHRTSSPFSPAWISVSKTYGSGDWGGVGLPDPTVVPQSDATISAEAMPEGEEYGGGSGLGGNYWAPDETAIDPGGYADSSSWSTSAGDEGA